MSIKLYFDNYQKPEYTKEEHPMAALYRLIGFDNNLTNHFYVVEQGERFRASLTERNRNSKNGPFVDKESDFAFILKNLELPKKKQGKEKLLNYYPYIPELSLVGNIPREASQVYNLGAFIKKTIEFGISTKKEGEELFSEIFDALSVKDTSEEDAFSVLLSKEIKDWFDPKDQQVVWKKQEIPVDFKSWNTKGVNCPATSFVTDIRNLIELKNVLTRFQWTNMVSGLMRLALPMHLLWIYRNYITMQVNIIHLMQGEKLNQYQKEHRFDDFLYLGDNFLEVRNMISNFKKSQMFIELFTEFLVDNKHISNTLEINNLDELETFYADLEGIQLDQVPWKNDFFSEFSKIIARESKELSIFQSKLKGRFWFVKHIMEQGSAEGLEHKKELDQYFWLKKKSGEFYLQPGAGQSLMLTYLSSRSKTYCSVNDLRQHLQKYGISIKNLSNNPMVDTLREMGLITDSPDSENGLTIHNPLNRNS